jgi:hypothetical protein
MRTVLAIILVIIAFTLGILSDNGYFEDVRYPVFSSFSLFLISMYILCTKKKQ